MGTVWMSKGTIHWLLKLLCAKSSQEDSCRNCPRLKVLECCLCKWRTWGLAGKGQGFCSWVVKCCCVYSGWEDLLASGYIIFSHSFFPLPLRYPSSLSPYFGSLAPLTVYFSLKWASLYFHYKLPTSLELKMEAVLRCADPSPHSASLGFVFSPFMWGQPCPSHYLVEAQWWLISE